MLARIVDEIPDDEEIAVIAHAVDDAELMLEALVHGVICLWVAFRQRLFAQVAQIRLIILVRCRNRIVRQLDMAKLERHVAALRDFHRVLDGLGAIGEQRSHFLRAFQIVVVAVEPHAVRVVDGLAHLDAEQDIVELAVLALHVMAVVRRDEADAVLVRELDETFVRLALLGQAVILDLEEIIVLAEDVDVLAHERVGLVKIARDQRARHFAGDAGRQADDALVIFAQQLVVDARLVIKALDVCIRHELHEVAIAFLIFREQDQMIILHAVHFGAFLPIARRDIDLAADDRLHALRDRFLVKINDAIHRAVIRDGDRVHARRLRRRDELRDAARAVEQAELRVNMKVRERDGRCFLCFVFFFFRQTAHLILFFLLRVPILHETMLE